MPAPFLALDGISVEFPGVKALKSVNLDVRAGQVHALMGENGAGKSTLLKVLSGVNMPSAGRIVIDGTERRFANARDALDAGVAIIYQELNLVPQMTVAENLLLGQLPNAGPVLDRRGLRRAAQAVLDDLGEPIDPGMKVGRLSIGQRQMVEIGKALLRRARIIAFDEPTSSLSVRETENLMRIIRRLRGEGRAIVYVTHRMDEVFTICDAVTVFRDGSRVASHDDVANVTRHQLVTEMVGREIEDVYGYRPRPLGDTLLDVRGLTGPGVAHPASFSLRRGEILGFFGLVGAGRTELMRLLCGVAAPSGGSVHLGGALMPPGSPKDAIRLGVALCPEDRKTEGIFPIASVADNLNVSYRRHVAWGGIVLHRGAESANAKRYIKELSIRTPNERAKIRNLSGGNQQKVIISRWLSEKIELLVMDEPTRGIDVGARSQIYAILYDLAASGKSVIVVSSDLPEVMSVCDRIAVMREGEITGTMARADATPEQLLRLALPAH